MKYFQQVLLGTFDRTFSHHSSAAELLQKFLAKINRNFPVPRAATLTQNRSKFPRI